MWPACFYRTNSSQKCSNLGATTSVLKAISRDGRQRKRFHIGKIALGHECGYLSILIKSATVSRRKTSNTLLQKKARKCRVSTLSRHSDFPKAAVQCLSSGHGPTGPSRLQQIVRQHRATHLSCNFQEHPDSSAHRLYGSKNREGGASRRSRVLKPASDGRRAPARTLGEVAHGGLARTAQKGQLPCVRE